MSKQISVDEIIGRIGKIGSVFGISRNELKVYFLLLVNGKMTAKDVSNNMNISYTKVYTVLSKLEARGWIKRVGKKPSLYSANPVTDVWVSVKRNIMDMVERIERELIIPMSILFSSTTSLYNVISVSSENLPNMITQLLAEPSNIYYFALSFDGILNDHIVKLLESNSYRSDVKVILVDNIKIELPQVIQKKYVNSMFGSGLITDKGILLIIKSSEESLYGLYSNHVYFIDIGKVYFQYLWGQYENLGKNA
ncbi:hypothetical protein SUSAZ_03825 [Sulfolobus acidocaldarius SUSAZ]|nr:hypothetical protein SUSAZ_03825 [Sulfolobus acidocaldarius SUSAZ]